MNAMDVTGFLVVRRCDLEPVMFCATEDEAWAAIKEDLSGYDRDYGWGQVYKFEGGACYGQISPPKKPDANVAVESNADELPF
jgi:hypothetical protein